MLICEVFDSAVDWDEVPPDHEEEADKEYTATFKVGDNQYQFYAYSDDNGNWEIEFRLDRKGYVPMSKKYGVANTGGAAIVFSTVVKIMQDLLAERKVESFRFSAKEPSRVKLYDAMSKKLKPTGWIMKTYMESGEKVYEFSKG